MSGMKKLPVKHWSYPLIALFAGIVMIFRIVSTTVVFSHTIDEPYHIGGAVVLWESKSATVAAQHPPLARWAIGLPLMLRGIRYPAAKENYVVSDFAGFGIGYDVLFGGQLPYRTILV